MPFEVLYYETPNHCPVLEFIDDQSPKMQAKIIRTIGLLAANGTDLREPHSKKLSDHIFELRCQTDGEQARILYFFIKGKTVILTNGFIKKTQKTPPHELAKAERYRLDYVKSELR